MENVAEQFPTKEKRTRNPASTTCPKCGSDDTRSFEMVHSEGTSSGTFSAGSYTFGGGATLTQGQTSNQSILASKTQPPEKPSLKFGALLFVLFGSFIVSMIFVSYISELAGWLKLLLVFGIAGALTVGAYIFERRRLQPLEVEYEKSFASWKRNWICLRCGNAWRRVNVT